MISKYYRLFWKRMKHNFVNQTEMQWLIVLYIFSNQTNGQWLQYIFIYQDYELLSFKITCMNIQFRLNSEKSFKVQRICQVSTINQNNKGIKRNLGNSAIPIRKKVRDKSRHVLCSVGWFRTKTCCKSTKKVLCGICYRT